MTESDTDARGYEMELDNLQRTISQVETALAVSTSGTRPIFDVFLQNAKARLGFLEKKVKDSHTAQESKVRDQIAVADMVQKETALNAKERETYGGFLNKEFFTKNDFTTLEQFYAYSWDRLSEGGKDQMSQRIWEGIRKKEYTFSELPKTVQEKEADRVYAIFKKEEIHHGPASRIPAGDRNDFIRAYEAGDRKKASEVLDRESFKNNLFLQGGEKVHEYRAIEQSKVDASATTKYVTDDKSTSNYQSVEKKSMKGNASISNLRLDGITMSEATEVSSANMPKAAQVTSPSKSSLRDC